jgi:hypothetical protein
MSSSGSKTPPEAEPPVAAEIPEEPVDLTDLGDGAPDPVRARFFLVVARTRMDLFLTIRRRFRDDRTVHVMLDRREQVRRSRTTPVYVPERRRRVDRRQPRDSWEDLAHHPAVLIPLSPHPEDGRLIPTSPAIEASEPDKEATMEPVLFEEARLLTWIQESQHVIQHVLPAVLDERDGLRNQLQDSHRRCRALEEENGRLRADLARAAAAHRQLEQGRAELGESMDQVLAQMGHVLGPMRELAERLATRRRP